MNSIIIVSKNREDTSAALSEIYQKKSIESVDQDLYTFEKTVGIPDIRAIQERLYLKPIKSKNKAVIIDAPQGLTTEAQNSLLKILEEPPENTFIMLVTPNKNSLLPTVLSRCKVIEIKEDVSGEFSDTSDTLNQLASCGVGEKLRLAQDFSKTKEETLLFLQNLIMAARKKLIENPLDQTNLKMLKEIQKTYGIIKSTNVTPRLTLENLFLSL